MDVPRIIANLHGVALSVTEQAGDLAATHRQSRLDTVIANFVTHDCIDIPPRQSISGVGHRPLIDVINHRTGEDCPIREAGWTKKEPTRQRQQQNANGQRYDHRALTEPSQPSLWQPKWLRSRRHVQSVAVAGPIGQEESRASAVRDRRRLAAAGINEIAVALFEGHSDRLEPLAEGIPYVIAVEGEDSTAIATRHRLMNRSVLGLVRAG